MNWTTVLRTGFALALVLPALCAWAQNKPGNEFDGAKTPDAEKAAAQAHLPVAVVVNEKRVLHPVNPQLLGISQNWYWSDRISVDEKGNPNPDFVKKMAGLRFPLTRIGGSDGQEFEWKKAVGPLSERKTQKLTPGDAGSIKRMGPLEWVRVSLAVDPKASFVPTLNLLTDTPEDNADLAELLCGDGKTNPNGGTNWAERRIAFGLKAPVPVAVWEVGNEMDWIGEKRLTQAQYIARCKKTIAAIRVVVPNAKFAVHAATAPDNPIHKKDPEGWAGWHRAVLKELGPDIDYIVLHTYYGNQTERSLALTQELRSDIKSITGTNRIGIFHSEHAFYPSKPQDKTVPWSVNWYQTHALSGCLVTAQWINQMLAAPDVIASYWCLQGGPWGLVYPDKTTGALWTTGMFDLYKLLDAGMGDTVVASDTTGERTNNKTTTFTATVMQTKSGSLRVLLVNREPNTVRDVAFAFGKKYRLIEETCLSGETLDSVNTPTEKNVTVVTRKPVDKKPLVKYAMPAKSVAVLTLSPM